MAWQGEAARLWKMLLYLLNHSVRLALFSTKVTMTFLRISLVLLELFRVAETVLVTFCTEASGSFEKVNLIIKVNSRQNL